PAPDLEDVAKALGGDHAGAGALALEQRVDADRRAVDHQPTVREVDGGLLGAAEDAIEQLRRCAEGLGVDDGPGGLIERHEIRERPADVDADPECHARALLAREYT